MFPLEKCTSIGILKTRGCMLCIACRIQKGRNAGERVCQYLVLLDVAVNLGQKQFVWTTINPILSSDERVVGLRAHHLLAPIRNGDPTLAVLDFIIVLRCLCPHEGHRGLCSWSGVIYCLQCESSRKSDTSRTHWNRFNDSKTH